jgi:hypothetical protein
VLTGEGEQWRFERRPQLFEGEKNALPQKKDVGCRQAKTTEQSVSMAAWPQTTPPIGKIKRKSASISYRFSENEPKYCGECSARS